MTSFPTDEKTWQIYQEQAVKKFSQTTWPRWRHGLSINLKPPFLPDLKRPLGVCQVNVAQYCKAISMLNQTTFPTRTNLKSFLEKFTPPDEPIFQKHYWLHQARQNHWLVINLPKRSNLSRPLEINLIQENGDLYSGIYIVASDHSQGQIVFNFKSQNKETGHKSRKDNEDFFFWSQEIQVQLGQGADLEIVTVQNNDLQTFVWQNKKAILAHDANCHWTEVHVGASFLASSTTNLLQGSGANCQSTVLYLTKEAQQYDIFTHSDHQAPHTASDIVTKGVVSQRSKALSRGLVKIGQKAFSSKGYEQQDALLIGQQSEADAIPNLEIHNHDVTCSHGSTVGPLNFLDLFYLQSRGLSKKEATKMIIGGYFAPVYASLSSTSASRLKQEIDSALNFN